MNKDSILVGNIQRFSVNDGPGIRTTVFLKGCMLKCPWCCNPENMMMNQQIYYENGIQKCFGKYYSIEELEKIILKDKLYYDKDGGVTFSGGDPLLQSEKIIPLINKLKDQQINICVETSLFVPTKNLLNIIDLIDLFYVDIKILDKAECKESISGNIDLYLKNVDYLFQKKKKVVFRFPVVNGYTNTSKNLELLLEFLVKYHPDKIEIFSVHNLAENKYKLLNIKYNKFDPIDKHELESIKEKIEEKNIKCDIIYF